MGIHRGPNTVKDGLVFGYDTGYGVADNSTATRFYPGEATANVFSNPNFANHTDVTVGTTSVIKQDFGDGRIGIQMIQAGTSDIAGFSMGSYSAPVSAGTYTWSSFIHSTSTGGKVKAQVTVYVNGVRHWLTSSNTWSTSVVECNHLFIATVANQWHRIENQFTLPTGTLTNLQLGSFYRTTSNFTIKIANAQLELKSHTTPFVDGTRSSTASLIDLKKTTDIDVSNVSFDSTGQPTFDGTSDRITFDPGTFPSTWSQPFSVEAVVYIPSGATWYNQGSGTGIIGRGSYTGSWGLFRGGTDNSVYFYMRTGSNTFNPGGIIGRDKYYHIVGTWDGISQAVFYIDGNQNSEETNTNVGSTVDNTGSIPVGGGVAFGGSNGGYGEGTYPVIKLYNKKLTAAEVKQNYNSYKNRFDI